MFNQFKLLALLNIVSATESTHHTLNDVLADYTAMIRCKYGDLKSFITDPENRDECFCQKHIQDSISSGNPPNFTWNADTNSCEKITGPGDFQLSLGSSQKYAVRNITDYGCWCLFRKEKINKVFGKPMDEIDSLCMLLNEGYKCVKEQTEAEVPGSICEPVVQNYNVDIWTVDPQYYPLDWQERLYSACDHTDICRKRTCIIETNFVLQYYPLRSRGLVNEDYLHEKGFEHETTCEARKWTGKERPDGILCCAGNQGIDPLYNVRRRHTFGDNWQCCGNKIYDISIDSCCDDEDGLIC